MEGTESGMPIAARLMNRALFDASGFMFKRGKLYASQEVKEFVAGFGKPGAEFDVLLEASEGRYRVKEGPKGLLGKVLDLPPIVAPEGIPKTEFAGTILDPELVNKYSVAVELEEPLTVGFMGKKGQLPARVTHLPVPAEKVSGFTGDIVQYTAGDRMGSYIRGLALYAEDTNLEALAGAKGLGFGEPTAARKLWQGTRSAAGFIQIALEGARPDKRKGFAGGIEAPVPKGGLMVRPLHLTKDVIGGPTQLERVLSGKAVQGERVFDAYITEADFRSWYTQQYGDDASYKKVLNRMKRKSYVDNFLDVYVQTDPAHVASRGSLLRLRLANRIKAYQAKSEIGVYMDPRLLAKLTRDLDLDVAKMVILDRIAPGSKMTKRAIHQAAAAEIEELGAREAVSYAEWAEGLEKKAIAELTPLERVQAGLEVETPYLVKAAEGLRPIEAPPAELLERRAASKALASLPYTQMREPRLLMGQLQGVRGAEELVTRLKRAGFPASVAGKVAGRLGVILETGTAMAAQQAIETVYQAPLTKGGKFIPEVEKAAVGVSEAYRMAREGASVESVTLRVPSARRVCGSQIPPCWLRPT
jgi:hypothetical protein